MANEQDNKVTTNESEENHEQLSLEFEDLPEEPTDTSKTVENESLEKNEIKTTEEPKRKKNNKRVFGVLLTITSFLFLLFSVSMIYTVNHQYSELTQNNTLKIQQKKDKLLYQIELYSVSGKENDLIKAHSTVNELQLLLEQTRKLNDKLIFGEVTYNNQFENMIKEYNFYLFSCLDNQMQFNKEELLHLHNHLTYINGGMEPTPVYSDFINKTNELLISEKQGW